MLNAVPLAVELGAVLAMFTVLWLVSLALQNASIVDVFWGLGFVALAAAGTIRQASTHPVAVRSWIMLSLVSLWGVRLAWHVARRNHGKPEDPRYAAMRERRGPSFWWRSLFIVFWLQAVLLWIIALPIWWVAADGGTSSLGPLDLLGVAATLVGLAFETIGDAQLRRFKADAANRGRILQTGLWRYTRHPNYFGDALVWWGLFLLAAATPRGWWTIVSPIVMTILLRWVSGVPLLESAMATRPGYQDYAARTNAFLPWLPRGSTFLS